MVKHEWRKKEKQEYLPKNKPELIQILEHTFISIKGQGNPNGQLFADCIGALYPICYAIKMTLKKQAQKPIGYYDYTVYPLEGIWDLTPEAQAAYNGTINKDDLVFKLMIRQPDFVSEAYFKEMLAVCQKKKPNALYEQLSFEKIEEGSCIQMLHIGSYDNEAESFALMEDFAQKQKLTRISKTHREIYLSDFRKTAEEKLKTVLRFLVK